MLNEPFIVNEERDPVKFPPMVRSLVNVQPVPRNVTLFQLIPFVFNVALAPNDNVLLVVVTVPEPNVIVPVLYVAVPKIAHVFNVILLLNAPAPVHVPPLSVTGVVPANAPFVVRPPFSTNEPPFQVCVVVDDVNKPVTVNVPVNVFVLDVLHSKALGHVAPFAVIDVVLLKVSDPEPAILLLSVAINVMVPDVHVKPFVIVNVLVNPVKSRL